MGLSALWETWKDGSDFGSESVGRFEIRTRFEWDKLSIAIQPPSLFFWAILWVLQCPREVLNMTKCGWLESVDAPF